MPVEVFVHKMTDHMESARIIQWRVKEGERVEQYQVIMEVETDKAVAELESPASGILKGIRRGAIEGAQVPVGETLAFIADPSEEVPELPPLTPEGEKGAGGTNRAETGTDTTRPEESMSRVRATPAIRRIARELNIDLGLVKGTGTDGKITEKDVRAFASARGAVIGDRTLTVVSSEPVEWVDLSTVQRLTGQRMLQSIQTAPQFALTVNADMTNALQLRKAPTRQVAAQIGENISITVLLVRIVATALKHNSRANASFDDGRVKIHKRVNIGVAIGAEDGLIVPVIKDADHKSPVQIAHELNAFRQKAQQMRFSTDDLSGGTFTISNLGMYGIDQFNAILNPPQSAILAVGRIINTPIALPENTITVRPMMSLTLTVDHRVIDGVQGARLLTEIKERLEKPDVPREQGRIEDMV
jgi:pyruvate dehydrogenase E2 component (dihydrolipoamide acetyltransferase)